MSTIELKGLVAVVRSKTARSSGLYRAVWRWHFYAGMLSIPFIVILCLSGMLWLFRPQLNSLLYGSMIKVEENGSSLSYQSQLEAVQQEYPGASIGNFAPGVSSERATRFDLTTKDGKDLSVFTNPYTASVTGERDNGKDPMDIALGLHGSLLTAKIPLLEDERWGDRLMEIVASWSILLLATGVFLWWPRGKRKGLKGVLVPRTGEPKQRTFWRDLHAVTGIVFSFITLFFLLTGLMWSGFWGSEHVWEKVVNASGPGVTFGSAYDGTDSVLVEDVVSTGKPDWAAGNLPVPESDHHGGVAHKASVSNVTLDKVVQSAAALGFKPGYEVALPADDKGSFAIGSWPDIEARPNQRAGGTKLAFIDQYSGKTIKDYAAPDFKPLARVSDLGIALHEGRQFGFWNQMATLVATLAVLTSAASGVVMWRKRKPVGLGAPPVVKNRKANAAIFSLAIVLGVLFPLLGVTVLIVTVFESLVVHRIPRLARALGAA